MSETAGHRLGRYRLIRRLAKGGMAEVYLARSQGARGFEKTVAIKRILPRFASDEQFINMMVDEAKITVLLNHANIAQIIEFGEAEDSYFIVMEYVPGQSLSALNKRLKKRFSTTMGVLEAAYIVVEMLQGLHAAHEQKDRDGRAANIIHRDVSPQNVLIGYDGNTKIIDFGIAKAKDRIERTQVGTIKGKLRYLAPEMIDPGRFGEGGQFDRRVDVFAAGIVLFELIAGRQLFQGENEYDVYKNITDNKIPDLAAEGLVDDALQRILERALAKHAEDRYRTAEMFADDLRAYVYRTDPSFKAQRIAALMDQCFEAEREALASLEAEDASQFSEMPQELTFARRGGSNSEVRRTKASRKRPRAVSMGGTPLAPDESTEAGRSKPKGPSLSDIGEEVNPSAKTAMVSAEHLDAIKKGGAHAVDTFDFDEHTAALSGGASLTATNDVTRLTTSEPFDEADTPATSTQHVPRPASGTKWAGVIAAASVFGVLLAVGGVLMAEKVINGGSGITDADPDPSDDADDADLDGDDDTAEPEDDGPVDGKVQITLQARPPETKVVVGTNPPEPVPVTLQAEAGTVIAARFEAPGYKSITKPIKVPDDQSAIAIEVDLEAEPVDVIIKTDPPDAKIKVDGQTHWPGQEVMPGERVKIEVRAEGYDSVEQTAIAKPGEDLVLFIKLDRPVTLSVVADPPDARIKVNGKRYKKGMRVKPGVRVTVTASAKGYLPLERSEVPEIGKDLEIRMDLAKKQAPKPIKPPKPGTLVVKAIPFWGRVTVDGETHDDTTPVRIRLSPGKHKVTVAHPPKGLIQRFTVTIKPGRTVTRTVTFQ